MDGGQHHFHVQNKVLEPAKAETKSREPWRAREHLKKDDIWTSSTIEQCMHQSSNTILTMCMYKILMNEYKIFYLYTKQ